MYEMKRYARAFVLLSTELGRERDVIKRVMELPEVEEAHIVPGDYDVLAVLKVRRDIVAPSEEEVMDVVLDKIAKIPGVRDTHTIIPTHSFTKRQE